LKWYIHTGGLERRCHKGPKTSTESNQGEIEPVKKHIKNIE